MRVRGILRAGLDTFDTRLSRMGLLMASVELTILAVLAAMTVHIVARTLEGLPILAIAMANITIQTVVVGLPLILYARHVITQLTRSRRALEELTRRLEVAAEEAHQANRAKSAFLANMSHELRTPLNAIMGFSEVMKDQHMGPVHNPKYLSYARDIHASGRYLLGIINDILDLSKIEAGKMSLDSSETFALRPTLEASLDMVMGLAEKFDVSVSIDLPDSAVSLTAVERMVRQILINLVGNAIKFTPAGGHVHVSSHVVETGYEICVRDTGVGMSDDDLAEALTPFGQIANLMGTKHKGTGLGLPLAKAMMELHGGTLAIESVPQRGTSVRLTFPTQRVGLRPPAAAVSAA